MPRYSVSPPLPGRDALVFGAQDRGVVPFDPSRDQALLGRLNEGGARRDVVFDIARETVIAFFGKRGSGKSYSLGVLAESLCCLESPSSIGALSRRRGALLFDTLNVFWSTANPFDLSRDDARFAKEIADLRRWKIDVPALDVEVWNPAGTSESPVSHLYRTFAITIADLSTEDAQDLMGLDASSPAGQLAADAWSLAREQSPHFDFDDVQEVVESNSALTSYYADTTRRAVSQRLRHFAGNRVFTKNGTSLRELLVPGRLAVLELGELEEHQRTVICAVLLRQIHRARQRGATNEKQYRLNTRLSDEERGALADAIRETIPPSWIIVDEAQTLFPAERATRATDAFVRFVKEGRNFGLSFALTTQQPSAVDQRVLSQVDTVICHQLTVEADISRMRSNMKSAEPKEVTISGRQLDLGGWLRSLEPGQAMVTNADFERAFCIEIRPRVCPHAGSGFRFEDVEASGQHAGSEGT